jgi:hypothetical protein
MDKPINHDSPWKDTIDQFTRSFLEVTFPDVAATIDWSFELVFLEQELHEITPASEIGAKRVDKLLKVRLLDGTVQWCGEPGCFVGPGSRWFVGIGGVEAGWSVGWEAC